MHKRITQTKQVPLGELTSYPENPRRGDVAAIRESLETTGQYRALVVRADTREVLAGNHTLAAMTELGYEKALCHLVEVDDEQARRIVLADNRTAELASYDEEALARLLAEMDSLEGTGWDQAALDELNASVNGDQAGTDTEPIEPPVKPKTKPGDLYLLGEHRLLCGDSTGASEVERLMSGQLAEMVFTDPPYGVEYTGGKKKQKPLGGDGHGTTIYDESLPHMVAAASPRAAFYIWYADLSIAAAAAAAAAAGLFVRGQVVWVKNNAQFMNNAHYHGKHEPCIYASLPARAPHWYGPNNEVTVWEYDRAPSNDFHPTQKPIELAERAAVNSSRIGEIVLDPFAGSGSTLIACENLSRRCYAMEIDPGYCDVIVDRWERHTGQKAARER